MTDFLHNPALPAPLDLNMIDPSLLADAPERLLALAADLLLPVIRLTAASTWTCCSAPGRRSRPNRGWRPGSRRCGRCAMG